MDDVLVDGPQGEPGAVATDGAASDQRRPVGCWGADQPFGEFKIRSRWIEGSQLGPSERLGVDELTFVLGGESGHDHGHVARRGEGGRLGRIVGGGVADVHAGQRGPQTIERRDDFWRADVGGAVVAGTRLVGEPADHRDRPEVRRQRQHRYTVDRLVAQQHHGK